MWDDDGVICQSFRNSLLKSHAHFSATITIPELLPLEAVWHGVGQTAGIALWRRDGKVGAASILLNGLELEQELQSVLALCQKHQLPLPSDLRTQVVKRKPPLLVTVHYDLRSFTDPSVITTAEALANAFFVLFGTNV